MEIRNKLIYFFRVLLFLNIQKCIVCLHLTHGPNSCCALRSLPDYSNLNAYSTNPLNNPLPLVSESDPLTTGLKSSGIAVPSPFPNNEDTDADSVKAYSCSLMPCLTDATEAAACACNYNTGHVVTFKNSCDVEKHNCRFNTKFKVILNEICPWEFQSRRNDNNFEIDYNNPKYYN